MSEFLSFLGNVTLQYCNFKEEKAEWQWQWMEDRNVIRSVCVCSREKDRERESDINNTQPYIHILWSTLLSPCVQDRLFWSIFWNPGNRNIVSSFYSLHSRFNTSCGWCSVMIDLITMKIFSHALCVSNLCGVRKGIGRHWLTSTYGGLQLANITKLIHCILFQQPFLLTCILVG